MEPLAELNLAPLAVPPFELPSRTFSRRYRLLLSAFREKSSCLEAEVWAQQYQIFASFFHFSRCRRRERGQDDAE